MVSLQRPINIQNLWKNVRCIKQRVNYMPLRWRSDWDNPNVARCVCVAILPQMARQCNVIPPLNNWNQWLEKHANGLGVASLQRNSTPKQFECGEVVNGGTLRRQRIDWRVSRSTRAILIAYHCHVIPPLNNPNATWWENTLITCQYHDVTIGPIVWIWMLRLKFETCPMLVVGGTLGSTKNRSKSDAFEGVRAGVARGR